MLVLGLRHGNVIKGGILSKVNQAYFRPQWFDIPMVRVIDRLILMVPIMKDSPDAGRIFKYVIEVSGVSDFPSTDIPTESNPFIAIYKILYKALKEPLPHVYFLNRVNVEGDSCFIKEDVDLE